MAKEKFLAICFQPDGTTRKYRNVTNPEKLKKNIGSKYINLYDPKLPIGKNFVKRIK